ncbi:NLR family CARD domain-containing protein 3-like [Stylophora pistillata]|uniref:NLR family CARD domain-containing protein 3-like n=1 Tax=Stylophora pistillata TaxID=50429 RepID=UPI000C0469D6|nr:NLR family CARD domain-containing protein 3-like [Stylophora pistillata]
MATTGAPEFPSTKDTVNYARLCRLLVDVGSQALRDTFDAIHPPVGLHTVLARYPEHAILQSLKAKKVLNATQWGKLYPTVPSSVSSADFDITLLMVLLRNICGLLPPSTGWDSLSSATDVSKEANIARLKYYRNTVYGHASQASVDDATFNSYWQDISNAILGLAGEGYGAATSKLKNECIDPDTEEHYRQLLKQWKQDEDNIKETVRAIEDNVDQIKSKVGDIGDKLETLVARQEVTNEQDKITNDLSQMRSLVGNLSDKLDTLMVQQGETKSEDGFDPNEMIDNIRQLYKTREGTMNLLPWCEHLNFSFGDFYTRLKVIYKEKTRGTATDRVVTMSEIFNPHEECEEPRVVLIEGKPGMGKTTYCKKVVFEWATPETGNYFAKFLIVLLIKCREVQSDIWEAIDDQLLPRDVDDNQRRKFFDFIRHNQSTILLVLDGLDEVSEKKLPMFTEIIQGRVLPNCRVVATARHESGAKVRKYCNTLLEVEGFTYQEAKSFIHKYFKTRKDLANKLTVQLRDDRKLRDMSAIPLNCALFCLVWEDLNGVFPESRSELYMDIVECVLRRYRAKKQLPENGEDLVELYESQLIHLGSIALKGLLEANLDFDEKELGKHKASDLPGFGFLSVQPGGSKLRATRRYGFLHKTFQEFFAALDLGFRLIKKEIRIESIAADRRFYDELKEVLLFTFGILGARCKETAENLVKSMTTHLNQEEEKDVPGGLDWDKEAADRMIVILECIYECKNDNNFDVKLARALGPCLQIKAIDVSHRGLLGANALLLTNVLMSNTSVTELNFSYNEISDDGAAALSECLKENTFLTKLDLSRNNIGHAGAAALAECLKKNTSLTKLNLSRNNIGETGAAALAECLKENTSLTNLNLGTSNIGDGGAAALADCFKENASLTELSLYYNNIGEAGAAALAESLKENTSLMALNLSSNEIGDAGAAALTKCLKENKSLTMLNLDENNIGETGAAALAECLKENTSLTNLNLGTSNIGDGGAAALAECLKENTCLTELSLYDSNIGEAGAVALAECLKENSTLTMLNLDENNIGDSGAAALTESLKENTSLTVLYRP